MKKIIFLLLTIFLFVCKINFAQVGIGTATPHPSSKLDITSTNSGLLIPRMSTVQRTGIPAPATGLQVFDMDTKSFWFYNGTGWIELSMGSATSSWSLNGTHIYNNNTGNVGIGTSTPANKFTVKSLTNEFGLTHTDGIVTVGSYIGNFGGATGGWFGTKSNHPLNFFTFNGSAQMTILQNGNVGIGTVSPLNKLQIGAGYAGFENYDLVMGDGSHATGFIQTPTVSYWHSLNTNISIVPGTGNLGINTTTPTNKLQIGSVGNTGFATNDLAIGNGTNAMAIYQTDASTLIGSTTDIILNPRNNGHGRVGINTNTPGYPLEVSDFVTSSERCFAFFARSGTCSGGENVGSTIGTMPVSIYASSRVLASEFNAYSDARIKNIVSISNSAVDLQAINALQITDYTMKDKLKYGNQNFKKVIAQEVEKVYPQVVSKHKDFIPNVYQVTSTIQKMTNGYVLSFTNEHNISKDAKKLRLIMEGEGMQEFSILRILSSKRVVIDAKDIKSKKIFVYGEEVDDFRTVDYEGLTTLNISATQELSKLIQEQQKVIDKQAQKIDQLMQAINLLKAKIQPSIVSK
jgi:uncharacterized coiled-coil protein SlyX